MREQTVPSSSRLKRHFAQRVISRSRHVLEIWQRLQSHPWNEDGLRELHKAAQLLQHYAERFEQPTQQRLASELLECLIHIKINDGRVDGSALHELGELLQRLSETVLRHDDFLENTPIPAQRKPVYFALQHLERAERLAQQLNFFEVTALALATPDALREALRECLPAAILMDIDFAGPGNGLSLANALQEGLTHKIPLLFYSDQDTDTPTLLAAVRAGGGAFFNETLDASSLLERIEAITTHISQREPYRALIIDDSRAQALYTERALNNAGISTRTLTDPVKTMAELADFQPDLIILDMYMPECSGTELAQVIRHDDRYVSVPIIYLSAEDDLDKQLDAMSEGGDDFLTKPIKPRHLIATVRNRAERARNLKSRMVRDSLTGLFNHTYTLQLLDDARIRAEREHQPLSFAMIDIDHFKKVNDTYGHPMGDRVIKSLSLFLKQRLRQCDRIGRYGGEEFAVIMPNTTAAAAAHVLDEIRERFAEIHYPAQPNDLNCTFSCGIAQLRAGMDSNLLTKHADEALYTAKRAGRDTVAVYPDSAMHGLLTAS
jgi:diguanylate cyclase (GGDEF)-like protein